MALTTTQKARTAEIANQSFVTDKNQKSFNVDKVADAPARGLVTSDSASKTVENSRNTLNELGSNTGSTTTGGKADQLSGLFEQISNLRGQLTTAKENERLEKERATDTELQTKLGAAGNSEEADANAPTDLSKSINAINGDGDTSGIEDPVMAATTQTTLNKLSLIEQQSTRLNDFAKTMSEYSQADVNDINATAMRSVEREIAENARVQRAMEFAGVVAGRAQMSPRVEGSLINEIIRDGLDRINVIEDNKTTAIRAARKAESEFNYQLFTDSVDLAKEYNQEIEDSVTALKAEVRQAEKDDQDKLVFAQDQEERDALILAGELIDATPEQINAAAMANNIDPSLLSKAVGDAKFEAEDRTFNNAKNAQDLVSGALTIENKRADLSKKYNDIRNGNGSEDSIDIPDDILRGFRTAGLSLQDSEAEWQTMEKFGLDGSVTIWLEGGYEKDQVKGLVSAFEASQRPKADDINPNPQTSAEIRLNAVIDQWEPKDKRTPTQKKMDSLPQATISNPDTFFRN